MAKFDFLEIAQMGPEEREDAIDAIVLALANAPETERAELLALLDQIQDLASRGTPVGGDIVADDDDTD